jgi:thymidylate synthase
MTETLGRTTVGYSTGDAAFRGVVSELLTDSSRSEGASGGAQKVHGNTLERLGFSFRLDNPRHRLIAGNGYGVDLKVAVARFVWMISGNNRLADIAFYEPKVRDFTDDKIIVPGSSYGLRMRQAFPGVDQVRGIIERLRKDRGTRQAAISIYQPTDATRESVDIPCTFGLMFHARGGKLSSQTIMRSNNVWALLPFNVFEFGILAELVAAEADLEPGSYLHYAGSMHLYERDVEKAEKLLGDDRPPTGREMAEMPRSPRPLNEIEKLVGFEADLRHASSSLKADSVSGWIDRARADLHPYWQQFAFILVAAVADRNGDRVAIDRVLNVLDTEYRSILRFKTGSSPLVAPPISTEGEPDLFSVLPASQNVIPITRTRLAQRFSELAIAHEQREGSFIGAATLLEVQRQCFDRLAARGVGDVITDDEFEAVLAEVRVRSKPNV